MDWNRLEHGGVTKLSANAADQSAADLRASAEDVWKTLADEVLSLHSPSEWDLVRVEAWPDSARVVLFPAKSPYVERTDRASLEVTRPSLRAAWDAFQHDERREPELTRTILEIFDALGSEWRAHPNGVARVECYHYEDLVRELSGEML